MVKFHRAVGAGALGRAAQVPLRRVVVLAHERALTPLGEQERAQAENRGMSRFFLACWVPGPRSLTMG